MKNFYFIILILLFISSPAFALGISPSGTFTNFQPNFVETYTIAVHNSVNRYMDVSVGVSGGNRVLNQYITTSTDKLTLEPNGWGQFNFTVRLPETLEPGKYLTYVGVSEIPSNSQGMVAIVAVYYTYIVYSPYPGKFIDIEFNPPAFIKQGENGEFNVKVISRGEENISEVKAKIYLLDPMNKTFDTIESSPISLPSKEEREIKMLWVPAVDPGIYQAQLIVTFDGGFKTDKKDFRVGDILVKITNVEAKNIKKNSINKFILSLQSFWNTKLDGMNIKGVVYKNGIKIDEFKSENFEIERFSEKNITVFWDSKDFEEGQYEANFILNYADKTEEKRISFEIKSENISFYLLIIVAIVLIIAVIIYIYKRSGKKRR